MNFAITPSKSIIDVLFHKTTQKSKLQVRDRQRFQNYKVYYTELQRII